MIDATTPDHTVDGSTAASCWAFEKTSATCFSGRLRPVRIAPMFPSPRTERVQPGTLVSMTIASNGVETVLWRWYDAVILGDEEDAIRLWGPAHGEVLAQPRAEYLHGQPRSRAYLSAGLPGADCWVAGPATATAQDADVELGEVEKVSTEHGLWDTLG